MSYKGLATVNKLHQQQKSQTGSEGKERRRGVRFVDAVAAGNWVGGAGHRATS